MIYATINDAQTIVDNGEGALLAGRYRVVRQLGKGGMGSVWLAEDTQLDGKQFAIKMLPSILVSNKRAYRQLKDEALVAMKLVHPNIVQIRAFEENNGNPFLVMDYIDGETLDDYLAEHCGEQNDNGRVERVESVGSRVPRDRERVEGHTPPPLRGTSPVSGEEFHTPSPLCGTPPVSGGELRDSSPETGEVAAGRRGMTIASSVMAGLAKRPEDRPPTCAAVLEGNGRVEHGESVGSRVPRDRERVEGHTPPPLRGTSPVSGEEYGDCDSPSKIEGVPAGRGSMIGKTVAAVALLALVAAGGWWWGRWMSGREGTKGTEETKETNVVEVSPVPSVPPAPPVPSSTPALKPAPAPAKPVTPKTGDTKTLILPGGAKMEMIYVEPQTFVMGSDNGDGDEKPVHNVRLTKGYWLGKTEVTQGQWRSVLPG